MAVPKHKTTSTKVKLRIGTNRNFNNRSICFNELQINYKLKMNEFNLFYYLRSNISYKYRNY